MGKSNTKKRGNEQYVPMPYTILKSAAWRSLSGAAVKVWFELHSRFHGGNNGKLTLSLNEATHALGIGKGTAQRAFQELAEKGFIALEVQGSWYHRKASEWRLTTKPMQTVKGKVAATNDWRNWRPPKTKRGTDTDPSASLVVLFENPMRVAGSK